MNEHTVIGQNTLCIRHGNNKWDCEECKTDMLNSFSKIKATAKRRNPVIDANVIASAIKQHEENCHKFASSGGMVNAEQFRAEMRRKIGCGTQRDFAISHDVSEAFVSDVLLGRREISYKMANAMGYRLVPMFQKVKE